MNLEDLGRLVLLVRQAVMEAYEEDRPVMARRAMAARRRRREKADRSRTEPKATHG